MLLIFLIFLPLDKGHVLESVTYITKCTMSLEDINMI